MNYREMFDRLKTGKPLQFFDFALAVEENTRKVYLALAESVGDGEIGDFFRNMAEVELAHYNLIADRYMTTFEAINGFLDFPAELGVEGLVEFEQEKPETMPNTIVEALELALKGEILAAAFYETAESLSEDPSSKAVLKELKLVERSHAERVEELIDQIPRPEA